MRYILSILFVAVYSNITFSQNTTFMGSDSVFSVIRNLQEVTITAEKRKLTSGEIPTAVTVISGSQLPGGNNPDLRNLSGVAPNFYMQESGLKLSTPIYMRGIGTVSGTPPVGLYVDGVPVFDKNAFIFDLYDVQQIEILRGPQTTLYGRNSISGLININTNPPVKNFGAQVQAGISSYNSQTYNAIVNVPIKSLYNKFSFAYCRSDGYFRNLYDSNKKSNPSDSYNIRYRGSLYTSNDWKFNFGINYNNSFDGGYAYYTIDSLKKKRYTVNYNSPSSYDRELLSSHLNIRKSGRNMIFNWMTSHSWAKDKQFLDADFTQLDVFDNIKKSKQNLVTQEISLQSSGAGLVNWTLGTFGFYKDLENKYTANFGVDKEYLLPVPLDKAKYYNGNTTWGIAGYGQLTLQELLPGLSVSVGLRYDYEHSKLDYNDSLLFTGSSYYKEFHVSNNKNGFSAWLPKFSVLQKWNNSLSSYINISNGYKAGGYNIIANEMTSQYIDLSYDKEKLWNYEVGTKYFNPSQKFNINTALFYIDWKDQQIFVMGMMGPSIKNAGDARSYGAEADLNIEFLPGVTYSLAAGYTNSKYYHHENKDYEGNHIVMAPEFTGNTGLMYRQPIKNKWVDAFFVSTKISGFGKQYFDEANLLKQDPYFLWDMDLGISGKHFSFHFWGKNLLDKAFFSYMLTNPVGGKLPEYRNMGQSGAPSRWGASLTIKI